MCIRHAGGGGRREEGGGRREEEEGGGRREEGGGGKRKEGAFNVMPETIFAAATIIFIQLYSTLYLSSASVTEVLTHLPLSNQQSNTSDTRRNTPLPRQEGIVMWSTLRREKRIM